MTLHDAAAAACLLVGVAALTVCGLRLGYHFGLGAGPGWGAFGLSLVAVALLLGWESGGPPEEGT